MVRRPLLPFLTRPRSSWLPSQRMLVRYGILLWSCCGSVWSCSDVLFMQVLPSVASGFACPMCRWDGHPCLLWVGHSSSPSGAFMICSCEAVWSWNRTEMQLVDEPNICLLSLCLGRTLVARQLGEKWFIKPFSHGGWKSYLAGQSWILSSKHQRLGQG